VYGNTPLGNPPSSETTAINPPALIDFRPLIDKAYLEAGAIVMRPGILYGKSGSITASVFHSIESIVHSVTIIKSRQKSRALGIWNSDLGINSHR
jgi:hypothetical protein